MARNKNEIVPFGLRIREGLRQKIEKAAKANGHSLNAESAGRLEGTFDHESKSLDFRTAVASLVGGGDNAQLLGMIASALQLATIHGNKDMAHQDNMEAFYYAVTCLIAAHSGMPFKAFKPEEMKDWPANKEAGFLYANAILTTYDLPPVIELPPSIANLGKPSDPAGPLAALGKKYPTKLSDL